MTWCVMEIFKFELCSKTELEKKMCKGIISNLLNRIIVMMDEELLFCEVQNYLLLRKFIEKFEDDRENGGKFLVLICRTLTNSRLLRRASDIRGYWDYRVRFETEKDAVELSDEEYFNKFGLNYVKLAYAKKNAFVMHPGPMNRGVEIDSKLADDVTRSLIQEQVSMGVAIRMACLEILINNKDLYGI